MLTSMRIAFLLCQCLLVTVAAGEDKPVAGEPGRHSIRVVAQGFKAEEQDISKVCLSAAAQLQRWIPRLPLEDVVVTRGKEGPITLYERNAEKEVVIRLDTETTLWAQYAYQFSHELCHVHCGFRPGPKQNLWFEESVCEAASLFCLRGMAKEWAVKAPYANWTNYAHALRNYADGAMAKRTYKSELVRKGLTAFYRDHEAEFRRDALNRELNAVVADALLGYLEEKPERWAAFGWLNATPRPEDEPFKAYLERWEKNAPEEHKETVRGVRALFGL